MKNREDLLRLFRAKNALSKSRDAGLGKLNSPITTEPSCADGKMAQGFLGVDVGSISTNLALVDGQGRVLAGVYVPTGERPIEAIREGYGILKSRCGGRLEISGVGTTGSGRYLAGKLLWANVIHNEITCQMKSTVHYFPEADTIFEIGGQDSKYISVKDGKLRDFTMNKICAPGIGSFLEERATLLGIRIEEEFSELAAEAQVPYDLGSRCTVFRDTELAHAAGRGVPLSDLIAGRSYSIARNYLEKVVSGRPVGQNIVFQGGVASNAAVVRAFSLLLGRTIQVHPFNRISGAIGAALLACERRPYEVYRGQTNSIHELNLRDIESGLDHASFGSVLKRCADRLNSIPMRKEQRPVVGIAGDLYSRQHPVANHNLYLKLETMGCEVWPAPFITDEVDFGLKQSFEASALRLRLPEAAAIGALILRKGIERWKVMRNFKKALPRLREPSPKDILEFISPYIGRDNNELVLLNLAKMVAFARRGADGVVNAICFNCMLGTPAEGIAPQIRRDYGNIPLPTLIYGTTELSSEQAKLETFVYQVRQFARKKTASRDP